MVEELGEYNLKKSEEGLGQLYPVLLDAHGNMIDGVHRTEDVPKWRVEKVEHIDTELKRVLARLTVNAQRRTLGSDEADMLVSRAAELFVEQGVEKGEIAESIREMTGWSKQWIWKHLPQTLKVGERVESGRKGAAIRHIAGDVESEAKSVGESESKEPLEKRDSLEEETLRHVARHPAGEHTCDHCGTSIAVEHLDHFRGEEKIGETHEFVAEK